MCSRMQYWVKGLPAPALNNFMPESIVLVDKKDNVCGFKEKFACHKVPVSLHRAISIVVFNKDKTKMLVTKRSKAKPTWGGFWTNAVCSHPFPGETYQKAAERRIFEELGFRTPLKEVFDFVYKAEMDKKIWGEHELDHVFIGTYEGKIKPNPEEISDYRWVEIGDLREDVDKNPKKYTPWFKMILEKLTLDKTTKMLQMVLDGQVAIRKDLKNLDNKLTNRIDGVEERLAKRIDKIGLQVASVEDDTPTVKEFDKLEKRVRKVEKVVLSSV